MEVAGSTYFAKSGAGAVEAFEIDRGGLAERHVEAVLGFQERRDDLLLNLAVQADGDVFGLVDLDEWVLFGELGEGLEEFAAVAGGNDGLQGGAGEKLTDGGGRYAELVADADVLEAAQYDDLSGLGAGDGTTGARVVPVDRGGTGLVRRPVGGVHVDVRAGG